MNPNECKYCGCDKFNADSVTMTRFRCGSSYWPQDEVWQIANGCAAKCAVQLVELRERIQRAVDVLECARRICVVISDDNDDPIESEHDGVIYVEAAEADRAAALLRGNSSKSSNSSKITTDDLAVADYYEAVRQRVPWMTSIEHIEGLVEGYRQCGLMVWHAAEQIKLIFGGGNGQAE